MSQQKYNIHFQERIKHEIQTENIFWLQRFSFIPSRVVVEMALASQLSVTDDSAYGFITINAEIVSKKRKLAQNDDRFEVVMSVYSPKADSMDVGVSVLKLKTLELTLMSFVIP